MFSGSIPALVTPFLNNAFAEDTFRDLVEWQIAEKDGWTCTDDRRMRVEQHDDRAGAFGRRPAR